MEIGERIYRNTKALANARNEQISDVEKMIGISTGYLSRSRGLRIDKAIKIAFHFGITLDELISGRYWEEHEEQLAEMDLREAIKRAREFLSNEEILDIARRSTCE
jgi:transcriptional regulator with XRE-family HTH domain